MSVYARPDDPANNRLVLAAYGKLSPGMKFPMAKVCTFGEAAELRGVLDYWMPMNTEHIITHWRDCKLFQQLQDSAKVQLFSESFDKSA